MYKELNEQELAGYCCEKDPKAEEELYKRYAARVFTLCRRYMSNDDDAADLMQDTLIRALEKIDTFHYSEEGSLLRWINRIAVNQALNTIKRKRWRWVRWDFEQQDNTADPREEEVEHIPQEKLLEWISRLPDIRRTVFNLYTFEGYSHKEIGTLLGISEKGSSSILAKARKQLKGEIRHYLKEERL